MAGAKVIITPRVRALGREGDGGATRNGQACVAHGEPPEPHPPIHRDVGGWGEDQRSMRLAGGWGGSTDGNGQALELILP